MPEYLNARQLAARFSVTPDTILAWHRKGLIPAIRLNRRTILFNFEAVAKALEARTVTGQASA